MKTSLFVVALVCVALLGAASCEKGAAAGGTCTTAADCVVVCFKDAGDCCGDACGCEHAFTTAEAAAITAKRDEACGRKDIQCPSHRCEIKELVPKCVDHKCIASAP